MIEDPDSINNTGIYPATFKYKTGTARGMLVVFADSTVSSFPAQLFIGYNECMVRRASSTQASSWLDWKEL